MTSIDTEDSSPGASIAQSLNRLLLVLVIIAIFFVVTLAVPDSEILRADAEIKVPLLDLPIRYATFVTFGPLALVGLLVYLHLFVEQLHRLKSRGYEPPETSLFTMRYLAAALISDTVIYGLVPAVLAWFTWKTLFRQEALWLFGLTTVTAFYAAFLYLRHSRACTASWRRFIAWGLLILLLIALLLGTVELWRRGKEALLQVRQLNLVEAELAKKDLRNVDLRYADLRGADLTNADLRGTTLNAADLTGATLKGANLKDARLVGAKLTRADLTDADLSSAHLTRAEGMSSATGMGSATLEGASLVDVNLVKADLDGADLGNANLSGANLARASMCEINLRNSDLRGAILGGATMFKANLSNANLGSARLEGAKLRGASLASADLTNANLISADLAQVNLRNANLTKADLYTSSGLDLAALTGATLCETRWFDGKIINRDCITSPSQKAPL